jgi:Zn-dependent protease with chaperone function
VEETLKNPPSWRNQSGEVVIFIVSILVILAVIFGAYKLVGYAADALAAKVPDKIEAEWFGGLTGKKSEWSSEPKTNDQKRAFEIFEKLKKAKGLRDLPFNISFIPDKTPNAFAMPGGSIAITDGLLKMVRTDIGIATVLGHEFGHHQHRHSLKMMGRSILLAGIMILVMGGDHGFILNTVLDLAEKSHSRNDEFVADEYGLKLVHKTFNTVKGADEFFIKLEMDPLTKSSKALNILSTHPYTPDRIKKLREQMDKLDPKG